MTPGGTRRWRDLKFPQAASPKHRITSQRQPGDQPSPPAKERAPLLKNPQAVKPKIGVKMRANVDTKRTKTSMRLARMVGDRKQGRNRRTGRSARQKERPRKSQTALWMCPPAQGAREFNARIACGLRSRAERDLTFRRTAPQWTVIEKAFIRSLSRSALASSSAKSDSKVTDSPRRSAIMV